MGCITSRHSWPPEPGKHWVIRSTTIKATGPDGKEYSVPTMVEDYVVIWPGLSCRGSASGAGVADALHDEQIGGQAIAIRAMEGS